LALRTGRTAAYIGYEGVRCIKFGTPEISIRRIFGKRLKEKANDDNYL
jgi:hypothetical protein